MVAERYRTFWPRFWAGAIDGLVFLPLSIGDAYMSSPQRGPAVLISWTIISYEAYWLYSVLLHARYGQTLGKRAMDVKVLDVSESRIPTFSQAVLRDIGYIVLNWLSLTYMIYLVLSHQYVRNGEINGLPGRVLVYAGGGWFLLEVLTMLTNSKRRAFHDLIAKTVVLRTA